MFVKTIILLVVLYGCETWSLILREERRLSVFETRRIFRPKRNANGKWRKRHNEELHGLYRSTNIKPIKLRWAHQVARMEEGRSPFKILTGTPTG
jgi:hypothetical protein